jgi:hypothetical protein
MADIKVTGFINAVKTIGSGTLVELAEKHRRKNPTSGDWENDGTATYYDVWVDRAESEPGAIKEDNLVTVEGSFKTKKTEKDGKTYYTNVINARTVSNAGRSGASATVTEWATPAAAEAPF